MGSADLEGFETGFKTDVKAGPKKRGLTLKVFVLGIVICFLGSSFFQGWKYESSYGYSPWIYSDYSYMLAAADLPLAAFGGALFLVAIVALVNRVKPIFTKQEIAVLLIITLISCATASPRNFSARQFEYQYPYGYITLTASSQEQFLQRYGGTFLCPEPFTDINYATAVADGSLSQGTAMPVDWSAWAPLFGYQTLMSIAMVIVGIAFTLLLQRIYIDIEAIEFPWGEMNLVGMEQVESWFSKTGKAVGNKYFLLGLIPAFLLYTAMWAPNELSWLLRGTNFLTWQDLFYWDVPWMPDTRPTGAFGFFEYNVTALGLSFLPWVAITLYWVPHIYGGLYLIPLDVLLGACVGVLITNFIIPISFTNLGYLGRWTGESMKKAQRIVFRGRWMFTSFLAFGLVIPLIILPLWTHRSTFKRILKSIFSSRASKEADPEAPIGYGYVWLMLLGGSILLILSFSYAPLLFVIPQQLLNIAIMFSEARLIAGGASFGPMTFNTWDVDPVNGPAAMGESVTQRIIVSWFLTNHVPTAQPMVTFYGLHYGGFEMGMGDNMGENVFLMIITLAIGLMSFYLAKHVNLDKKDIAKTLLIFLPITMILSNVFHVLYVHWVDVNPPPSGPGAPNLTVDLSGIYADGMIYPWSTSLEPWYWRFGGLAIGIAINTAFYLMRARYSWSRIDAAGVFFGATLPGLTPAIFIALGLKYLTYKVGGPDVYQKIGKPLAVGLLFAWGASFFLHHGLQALFMWRTAFGIWPE